VLAYVGPYLWPWFAGAFACMLLYSASSGAVPYLVRALVDRVLSDGDAPMLRVLPFAIVAVFVVRALVNFGHVYLGEYVGQHIVFDLRRQLNDKIQHLPSAYFDRVATGAVLSRITTDVLALRQALTEGAAAMLRDATTVVVLLVVAFYLDFTLAVIAFVVFPAVVLPLQGISRKMRRLSRQGLDTLGNLSALLQETIVGNRVVKAFGMEDYEKTRFEGESDRLLTTYMRAARLKAFTTPMTEVLAAIGVATVIGYGGASVLGGTRTAGGLLAFLTAVALLYEPFKKLVRTNNLIQTGLGAAERIFSLLDEGSEDQDDRGERSLGVLRDAIRFERVSFAYGDDVVLREATLEVRAGQVLALVGPSGGGKSTIADLIPRFYDIGSGRLTFDGVAAADLDLASLRSQVAIVTQFTFLFNDSVRNNIAYGRIDTTEEAIVAAARAANADEFIRALPDGYDTVVGELGMQLSGGQRQRIAIARALLKDAPILILDEATSALDVHSERLVQAALDRLMRGRTTLVIAHRLSTIRKAHRIAVVDNGCIVEEGTHEELMARGERYKRLHDSQFDRASAAGGERAA